MGLSFLLNDSHFGNIEKALKTQQCLYTPQDYINVMRNCRKKNPLIVKTMENTDFNSSAALEQMIVNIMKIIEGHKINWLQVRDRQDRKTKERFLSTIPNLANFDQKASQYQHPS